MIPLGLAYSLGTLMRWAGLLCILRVLYQAIELRQKPAGIDPAKLKASMGVNALVAAVGLLGSGLFLKGHEGGALFIPLVWCSMSFWGWLAVVSGAFGLYRFIQIFMTIDGPERQARARQIIGWGVTFLVAVLIYRRDPTNQIEFYKGGVDLTAAKAGGLLALAVAAVVAMGLTSQSAVSRGWAKVVATHLALIAGSIVFGIPFAWLVITSFKEDADMASPHGIVWIPKVTEQADYLNPDDPMLEGEYKGMTVTGNIQERKPGGLVVINVIKPASMAGSSFTTELNHLKVVPKKVDIVTGKFKGQSVTGMDVEDLPDGSEKIRITQPVALKGQEFTALPSEIEKVRHIGLKFQNYPDALEYLPPEAQNGLVYLYNTLYLVVLSVIGTLMSSAIVAYAFSRMRFPGQNLLFSIVLSTMMLPSAVTLLPQFLIFRSFGWIDTLRPLWVPAFLGSAFNIFLLRQFLMNIPMELEDAAKIDGCTYLKTFWSVMLPQIKPAMAVIGIWTFMGAWSNFMGPLIYVSSPEHMTLMYALQMYNSDRSGEPGFLMAFATLSMIPVLALFFFAQKYFIEGVTLSGLGGR